LVSPRGRAILLVGLLIAFLPLVAFSAAVAAEPAKVTLIITGEQSGRVAVTALLVDGRGAPAVGMPVVFKARTAFGWLTLAETTSDGRGRAVVLLRSTLPTEVAVEAGEEDVVRTSLILRQSSPREAPVRPGREALRQISPQPGLISPYPVPLQAALLALVLGGVWTTYGYVFWLLRGIRGSGAPPGERSAEGS
jgi:hypothetical protein